MGTLFGEFQIFVQNLSATTTTLETFQEKAKYFDPVRVTNLDVDATYHQLSHVIIQWLLDLHSKKLFNKTTLVHLVDMLSFPDNGVVTSVQRAKMMCLLAMSKSDFNGEQLNRSFFLTNQTKLMDSNASASLSAWRPFSELIIKHDQINELIEALLRDTTGMPVNNIPPTIFIRFVHSLIDGLRGYTGINCIYINTLYVQNRHQVYQMGSDFGDELHDVILKMNLFCIVVHELAYARLRQVLDDPNTSSPVLLANSPTFVAAHGGSPEFGRLCECRLFGQQLDFWNTQRQGQWTDSHSTYFTSFIQAVETNQHLPSFNMNQTPCATRASRCTIGSDIDSEELESC